MLNMQALPNFDNVAKEILVLLQERLGFDLWMITRMEQNDWIVLYKRGKSYSVAEGDIFHWPDTFCYRMVNQGLPRVVADCAANPVYADAPVGRLLAIGAYIGIPLTYSDGRLFGTLCAIHPTAMPERIAEELPLLEVMARMMGLILSVCLDISGQARSKEQREANHLRDQATGLYNCPGWYYLLSREERRCHLYGHSACIISIHLKGVNSLSSGCEMAGVSAPIAKLAEIIQSTARKDDVVARIGDSAFAILAVESTLAEGTILLERLNLYLRLAQLDVSTAIAARQPRQVCLSEVWQQADAAAGATL
ncbi:MAG: GAF domain-containing protein [Cyanobacteria bacterium P01_A01_bin.135]